MVVTSTILCRSVVVLVEDEDAIRNAAVEALSDAGFSVLEAEHAGPAIEILGREASRVSALFTDFNMPDPMDGLKLAHHTRKQWPWIGLLLTSGQMKPSMRDLPQNCRFVAKPYDLGQVMIHLREMSRAA